MPTARRTFWWFTPQAVTTDRRVPAIAPKLPQFLFIFAPTGEQKEREKRLHGII
jgi:hypothetical protein